MVLRRNVAIAVAVTTLAAAALVATQLTRSSDASGNLNRFELKASDLPGYTRKAYVSPAEGCSGRGFTGVGLSRLRARRVAGCTTASWEREAIGVVHLVVYLFEDASSASAALSQYQKDFLADATDSDGVDVVSRHSVAVSELGDEAPRGVRLRLGVGPQRAWGFAFWWRRGNVVAALATVDRVGDQRAPLALARTIDERATS